MIAAPSYRGAERQPTGNWLSGPGIEVLWTAAIALLCVTLGYKLLPGFMRMMGKSGRIESVEMSP